MKSSYISDIKDTTTLILSHYWTPIGITSAKEAIRKLSRTSGQDAQTATIKTITSSGELMTWDDWIDAGTARYYTNQPFVRTRNNVYPVPTILLTTARWAFRSKTTPTIQYLYQRFNGKCQICGEVLPVKIMTIEHILPKSKHGPDDWHNITMTCKPCNTKKDSIYPYNGYGGDELKAPNYIPNFHTFKDRPEWLVYIFKKQLAP